MIRRLGLLILLTVAACGPAKEQAVTGSKPDNDSGAPEAPALKSSHTDSFPCGNWAGEFRATLAWDHRQDLEIVQDGCRSISMKMNALDGKRAYAWFHTIPDWSDDTIWFPTANPEEPELLDRLIREEDSIVRERCLRVSGKGCALPILSERYRILSDDSMYVEMLRPEKRSLRFLRAPR